MMNYDVMIRVHVFFITRLFYLCSCMLSDLCGYSGQVVALDLQEGYMLDCKFVSRLSLGLLDSNN